MRAVVNRSEIVKEDKFPKPMEFIDDPDLVVLFSAPRRGAVVSESGGWTLGDHSAIWTMSEFKDFHGSITIHSD